MKSTSGLSICPRNWRAYADSDSTYLRWPSANSVSNANEDLPEPDRPVNTTMRLRGNSKSTFLRLCSRAPWMVILRSLGRWVRSAMSESPVVFMGAFLISRVRNASLVSTCSTTTSLCVVLLRLVVMVFFRLVLPVLLYRIAYFVVVSNRCSIWCCCLVCRCRVCRLASGVGRAGWLWRRVWGYVPVRCVGIGCLFLCRVFRRVCVLRW